MSRLPELVSRSVSVLDNFEWEEEGRNNHFKFMADLLREIAVNNRKGERK